MTAQNVDEFQELALIAGAEAQRVIDKAKNGEITFEKSYFEEGALYLYDEPNERYIKIAVNGEVGSVPFDTQAEVIPEVTLDDLGDVTQTLVAWGFESLGEQYPL
jgi:hypothetical protein